METYNNIRQIYPSFRLSTILKSIESTIGYQIPEVAEELYRKIDGNIFTLSSQDGRHTLTTVIDIQSPYLIKSYQDNMVINSINERVKYIVYELHVDVFNALRQIYLRENSLNFPFFNSYIAEYWNSRDILQEEEYDVNVHNRILELKPNFDLDLLYRRYYKIYEHSKTPLTFQLPEGINKVQFNGKEILFETIDGNKIFPCNISTYDVVISQLNLQNTRTIPFVEGITHYHSTYTIKV